MHRYFVKSHRSGLWRRPQLTGRLPDHYYRHRRELEKPTKPVHDIEEKGDLLDYYVADQKTLRIERKPDLRIPSFLPKEADHGLWAGDGIVKGYTKPEKKLMELMHHVYPKIWFPKLHNVVVYSEVLDKYLRVIVTDTAIKAIENACGFDHYILSTPVQDLKSQLGLDLRRKMLITIAKRSFTHRDESTRQLMYAKYKEYEIPLEEAEWFGLTITSAVTKQALSEQYSYKPQPLKWKYKKELLAKLQEMVASGELKKGNEEPSSTWDKLKQGQWSTIFSK